MRLRILSVIKILAILFIFNGLVSCKITKDVAARKIKPMSPKKIYNNAVANYQEYNSLAFKSNIKVENEKTTSFKANIKLKRDSIINISISPALGIEVFKIELTKDSIKYIDRINGEYFLGDYEYLNNMFHVEFDFNILQSIMTNEIFVYPYTTDTTKIFQYFKSSIDSTYYCLENDKEKKLIKKARKHRNGNFIYYALNINPYNFKIEELIIKDFKRDIYFSIEYSDFDTENIKSLPSKLFFNIKEKNKETKINVKYSKISVDKNNQKYLFKIPEKYEKVNK